MHARVTHLLRLDRRSHADHPWAALVLRLLPTKYITAQAAALCTQHNLICWVPERSPHADMRCPWADTFSSCCIWLLSARQVSY